MSTSSTPNILFILSDQQRWDTVGCYGRPILDGLTPHLDQLAAEGTRFNFAFSPQPVCGPCRAVLQTGQWATQVGCHKNNCSLPLDAPTIAKSMNGAGYETAYVGKWHLASDDEFNCRIKAVPEERRGGYRDYWMVADTLEFTSSGYEGFFFDGDNRRVDWEGYRVDATANFVIDYLRQYRSRQSEKPFFCFASFIEPHHQNDLDRYIGPMGSKERFKGYRTPGDLVDAEGDWRPHMPDYLGCCWSLDQNVARIREELETLGLAENTLIVYTSDHGCHFRTRNSEYKRSCHEASIRVPLIVNGPGFEGGKVVDELVSLIDLPPTVLRAAGIELLETMGGRALQELTVDGATDWPDHIFTQISESQVGRGIRTSRWKYGVTDPDEHGNQPKSSKGRYVEQYLYDLDADEHEVNNLVADPAYAQTRAELAAKLKARVVASGEPEPIIEPSSESGRA